MPTARPWFLFLTTVITFSESTKGESVVRGQLGAVLVWCVDERVCWGLRLVIRLRCGVGVDGVYMCKGAYLLSLVVLLCFLLACSFDFDESLCRTFPHHSRSPGPIPEYSRRHRWHRSQSILCIKCSKKLIDMYIVPPFFESLKRRHALALALESRFSLFLGNALVPKLFLKLNTLSYYQADF